jgi:hypothetical protein
MNGDRRRVIVAGESLILQGVRASLERRADLEVVLLVQPPEASPDGIGAYRPAVIIFDVSAIQPKLLHSLFQQPDLLLIGIDPETHQAHVWSGRQTPAVVAADLLEVIFQGADDADHFLRGTPEPGDDAAAATGHSAWSGKERGYESNSEST